jgi:TOBE domain
MVPVTTARAVHAAHLDGARVGRGDLPGVLEQVRFAGPHTDYHVATPAGTLLIREAGPPRAGCGPVRWSLLAARLMPREHPAGPRATDPGDLRP